MKNLLQKQSVILTALLLLTLLLSLRLFWFVNEYGSVLWVRDRWGSFDPLFYRYTFWEAFTDQHGPHRRGLTYVLFLINAKFSDWNGRWDLFLQAGIYSITALLALALKHLLFRKYQWSDLLIPLLFITLQSALTLFANPYVHGLIPLFAVMIAMSWFITNPAWRIALQSILVSIALFTGFSLVAACAFLIIEFMYWFRSRKPWHLILFILPLASLIYIFTTQRPGGEIGLSGNWLFKPQYAFLLGGNFIFGGISAFLIPIGLTGMAGVGFLYFSAKKPNEKETKTIALLMGSSFIFILLNLMGRSDSGLVNALSSRYIPATMPLMFAIYLLCLRLPGNLLRSFYLSGLAIVLIRSQINSSGKIPPIARQHQKIMEWEQCLKLKSDYKQCYGEIGFPLMPNPEENHIQEKINYLKERKLNIYRGGD